LGTLVCGTGLLKLTGASIVVDTGGVMIVNSTFDYQVYMTSPVPVISVLMPLSGTMAQIQTYSSTTFSIALDSYPETYTSGLYTFAFSITVNTIDGPVVQNDGLGPYVGYFNYVMNCTVPQSTPPIVGGTTLGNGLNPNQPADYGVLAAAIAVPIGVVLVVVIIVAAVMIRRRQRQFFQRSMGQPSLLSSTSQTQLTPTVVTDQYVTTTSNKSEKPSTSMLMGFSTSKDKLPLIADYRDQGGILHPPLTFGVSLASSAKSSNGIPVIVEVCVAYLEQHALNEEGLFRLAGSSSEVKMLKATFDKGQIPDFSTVNDVNCIADIVKLYIRNLPQKPILMTRGIKEASELKDRKQIANVMVDELRQIPDVNYYTLKRIFGLLTTLTRNTSKTRMTPENIGTVLHPTLQIPVSIIAVMIDCPHVFAK